MSEQILIAIALLCQATGSGDNWLPESGKAAAKRQLECQKSYIICIEKGKDYQAQNLTACIKSHE